MATQDDVLPEPWLRGQLAGVPPWATPLFHSFEQVREDLDRHVRPLTTEQIWRQLPGGSLGFHLKHIAGSVDRLAAYLGGTPLTEKQMAYLRSEKEGVENAEELLERVALNLAVAEKTAAALDENALYEARHVGRKRLKTTAVGLLVHLAEHTQRHLGQCITLAHMLRADAAASASSEQLA